MYYLVLEMQMRLEPVDSSLWQLDAMMTMVVPAMAVCVNRCRRQDGGDGKSLVIENLRT
jgi:hypothetical protein